jgi:hypothetical protein
MSTSEDRGSQLGRSAVQQAPMRDGQDGTACEGDPRDLSFHPPPRKALAPSRRASSLSTTSSNQGDPHVFE